MSKLDNLEDMMMELDDQVSSIDKAQDEFQDKVYEKLDNIQLLLTRLTDVCNAIMVKA